MEVALAAGRGAQALRWSSSSIFVASSPAPVRSASTSFCRALAWPTIWSTCLASASVSWRSSLIALSVIASARSLISRASARFAAMVAGSMVLPSGWSGEHDCALWRWAPAGLAMVAAGLRTRRRRGWRLAMDGRLADPVVAELCHRATDAAAALGWPESTPLAGLVETLGSDTWRCSRTCGPGPGRRHNPGRPWPAPGALLAAALGRAGRRPARWPWPGSPCAHPHPSPCW